MEDLPRRTAAEVAEWAERCAKAEFQGLAASTTLAGDGGETGQWLRAFLGRSLGPSLQGLDGLAAESGPGAKAGPGPSLEELRALVAGPGGWEAWVAEVRAGDSRAKCGLVWPSNSLAYRCRTCGVSPCMSLCVGCFKAADHQGHDYNLFRSMAGGACDCGDGDVMRHEGFCPSHGPRRGPRPPIPPRLTASANFLLPQLLARLLHHFRSHCVPRQRSLRPDEARRARALLPALPLLKFLKELADLGLVFHELFHRLLSSSQLYGAIRDSVDFGPGEEMLAEELSALPSLCDAEESEALETTLDGAFRPHNVLEELTFWLVHQEFPEALLFFLLSLLPLDDYRWALGRAFSQLYGRVARTLMEQVSQEDALSTRIVHLSVQLLSSEETALALAEEGLLVSLVSSLHSILKRSRSEPAQDSHSSHRPLDCEGAPAVRNHFYYSLVSDLHNLLSHPSVALLFAQEPLLVHHFARILHIVQGTYPVTRQIEEHLQFESRGFSVAFTAEMEMSSGTLSSLRTGLEKRGSEAGPALLLLLQTVSRELERWLAEEGLKGTEAEGRGWELPPLHLLWHIPLHRWWSTLVLAAADLPPGPSHHSLQLPGEAFLRNVFLHPLQIQVGRAEIGLGMWVRNGMEVRNQAIVYSQPHFNRSFADPDLATMQIVAGKVSAEWTVLAVLERFHLVRWLSFSPREPPGEGLRASWEAGMVEAGLRTLAELVGLRLSVGESEEEALRSELAVRLAAGDAAYSALVEWMGQGERWSEGHHGPRLASLLQEMAEYVETGGGAGVVGPSQGRYRAKPALWDAYDPLRAHFRSSHSSPYHQSLQALQVFARKEGLVQGKEDVWPPFRVPREDSLLPFLAPLEKVLRSRALLATIYTTLHRAAFPSAKKPVSEGAVQLAVHLLELALLAEERAGDADDAAEEDLGCCGQPAALDLHFLIWFPGRKLHANLAHRIQKVLAFDSIPSQSKRFSGRLDAPLMPELEGLAVRGEERRLATTSPTSFSEHIPFIDSQSRGAFWEWYWAALPSSVRRLYVSHLHKPPITLAGETQPQTGPSVASSDRALCCVPPSAQEPVPIVEISSSDESQEEEVEEEQMMEAIEGAPERPSLEHSGSVPALPSPQCYSTDVGGHSILSLLILLAPRYSAKEEAYTPAEGPPAKDRQRISNGHAKISAVLDLAFWSGEECRKEILARVGERERRESERRASEGPSAEDTPTSSAEKRKAAAKAMQSRLMAAMAKQQASVLSKLQDQMSEEEAVEGTADEERKVHCVICNEETRMGDGARPVGLVGLAEATSVLGSQLPKGERPGRILERGEQESGRPLGAVRARGERAEAALGSLARLFDPASVLRLHSSGWNGGVALSSCGHFVHLACHRSYLQVLRNDPQAAGGLDLGSGQFNCPFCRQASNVALPVMDETASAEAMEAPVKELIQRLNGATFPKFSRPLSPLETMEDEAAFLRSVLRTNLELPVLDALEDDVAPGTSAGSSGGGPDGLLIQALTMALTAALKEGWGGAGRDGRDAAEALARVWEALSGLGERPEQDSSVVVDPATRPLPVLLADPVSLLIYFLLGLGVRDKAAVFRTWEATLVLKFAQACLRSAHQLSQGSASEPTDQVTQREATDAERGLWSWAVEKAGAPAVEWGRVAVDVEREMESFVAVSGLLVASLCRERLGWDGRSRLPVGRDLRRWLRGGEEAKEGWVSWERSGLESGVAGRWWSEVETSEAELALWDVAGEAWEWEAPRLLGLPESYDEVFQAFLEAACGRCRTVPKKTLVCLVCGGLVCGEGPCCASVNLHEAEYHAMGCGAGTGLFLWVQTSMVCLVREKRTAVWGSLYLDAHGEEDNKLRRGRPLRLSAQRLRLLQRHWRLRSLHRTARRWHFLPPPAPPNHAPQPHVIVL